MYVDVHTIKEEFVEKKKLILFFYGHPGAENFVKVNACIFSMEILDD